MCDDNFSQSRCLFLLLAMSNRVYSTSFFLHAAMNLRPPSVTVSTHTSASNAVVFQSPAMPNARMPLCKQSVHSFSFPPRPLRTAPSRFPNTIPFGNRPSLIRMSAPAHESLLGAQRCLNPMVWPLALRPDDAKMLLPSGNLFKCHKRCCLCSL